MTFFNSFKLLTQRSNIHGLNHIFTATSLFWRLIWTILWLCGITGFIYNLVFILERYNDKLVTVKEEVDYEPFIWPDITFCNNMASYSLESMEKQRKWMQYTRLARSAASQLPIDLFAKIDRDKAEVIRQYSLVQSTVDPREFDVGRVSEWIPSIFVNHRRRGIQISYREDYNDLDYTANFLPVMFAPLRTNLHSMPCYTIQLSRLESGHRLDEIEKLSFLLHFHHESHKFTNLSTAERYISVFLSRSDEFAETEPIKIEPGYITEIAVSMLRTRREVSKQRCRTTQDYQVKLYKADLLQQHQVTGSTVLCHQVASQRLYIHHCACYSPHLPYPVLSRAEQDATGNITQPVGITRPNLCLNMSLYTLDKLTKNLLCMTEVYTRYSNQSVYENTSWSLECQKVGELPHCDEVTYDRSIVQNRPYFIDSSLTANMSRNIHMSSYTAKLLKLLQNTNDDTDKFVRENLGMFQVKRSARFGRLLQEKLQYTITFVLSDLGGHMGLWMGVSVLALFEIAEFLHPAFCYLITKVNWQCNTANKQSKSENEGEI